MLIVSLQFSGILLQVNREMLAVIESLQRQAEDENSEESSDVSKPCDSSDKVLEEIKDNELNQPHKRRKE